MNVKIIVERENRTTFPMSVEITNIARLWKRTEKLVFAELVKAPQFFGMRVRQKTSLHCLNFGFLI